ncbi:MAG: peptidoglycan DD-metalloendopeptidase family protein, partial [Proteobacteria bacterium]|nr:peptidoglycan DD-metalloendopeptidase family protein [Pseudomonadota bacterium]
AAAPAPAASAATAAAAPPPPPPPPPSAGADNVKFIWPAKGAVIARFDEDKNKGLGIGGKEGEPVVAAADGRVVYAGAGLRGYGNLIIIKHNNTFLTAYAHNKKLLVKEDQNVKKGQEIAEMGSSDADRVKLHFEIRRSGKPVDPARYLPPR